MTPLFEFPPLLSSGSYLGCLDFDDSVEMAWADPVKVEHPVDGLGNPAR